MSDVPEVGTPTACVGARGLHHKGPCACVQIWLAKARTAGAMPAASRALYELRLQWDIYREVLAVFTLLRWAQHRPAPALLTCSCAVRRAAMRLLLQRGQ